jgi:fluoride exporter
MVFIGGGIGSICRYGITRWMNPYEGAFPIATFIANALSCIIIGMLVGYFLKGGVEQSLRLLLVTGFCGGFSTFSAFSYETFELFQVGDYTNAFVNVVLSILVCLFCVFIGIKIIS